ncbi:MAG: rRNA maturation RNase YbeY [Actinomycetota bacterium]|nr:rRNA maturation RNase YbeY [Actinomycetota bacterium]
MSVEVDNETDHDVDARALVSVARHVLDTLGVSPLADLAISLVGVERMTELHVQWMDEPGPTDVMAFPMDELDVRTARASGRPLDSRPQDSEPLVLGDVVLCPTVAEKQAAEAGHSTADELALLTAHGVLHLLGYDHREPDEHTEMFGLQGELLGSWKAS